MAKFFGTDGVRGLANAGKITPLSLLKLGQISGQFFSRKDGNRTSVVIGKDTRLSGDMIEASLIAGLTSVGVDIHLAGVIPTSGVSLMVADHGFDFGIMITASHNAFPDNGIKFFGRGGSKLSDADEAAFESAILGNDVNLTDSVKLGRVSPLDGASARYIDLCKLAMPKEMRLDGLKIVIDGANGAAHHTAPKILEELGADLVIPIGVSPSGDNINAGCGSTATALLSEKVLAHKADVGVALDGDADRLIMCDQNGKIIDGDQLLGLVGTSWAAQGRLAKPGVVATVMSNLGLERHLKSNQLDLIRTGVGDRLVAARMRQDGYNLGGEQSGHILMTEYSPTGDGTIAALQVLLEMKRQNRPASDVLSVFEPVPQVLKNVRYSGESPMTNPALLSAIKDADADLGASGRVLIRASGTEPLIRVMAEGDDPAKVEATTDALVSLIETLVA